MRSAWLLVTLLAAPLARAAEATSGPNPPEEAATETKEAADSRRADAKARYEQGVAAYSAGRFKDAVDLFREADRLAPSAPLSFNIARAYEKLGDDAGALRWYRDYLRRAPDASNVKDVQALVRKYEGRLAAKGVQQLTVMSDPSGATVAVDERPVGVTPWTGELAPGSHRVDVTRRGFEDTTLDVRLAPDRAEDLMVRLKATAPGGTQPPAPLPPAATPDRAATPAPAEPGARSSSAESPSFGIWPYVTMGAGAAVLGGALAFEMSRRNAESDAENDPTQVGYQEKLERMENRQTMARILAGAGGVLVIAGGVLLTVDLTRGQAGPDASVGVAPTGGGFVGFATGRY